jgi:hypothetical protein
MAGHIRWAPSPGPPRLVRRAEPGCPGPEIRRRGTQVLGRRTSGRHPHGLLLGLAPLRDSQSEHDQVAEHPLSDAASAPYRPAGQAQYAADTGCC